jgi:hypothetical protein
MSASPTNTTASEQSKSVGPNTKGAGDDVNSTSSSSIRSAKSQEAQIVADNTTNVDRQSKLNTSIEPTKTEKAKKTKKIWKLQTTKKQPSAAVEKTEKPPIEDLITTESTPEKTEERKLKADNKGRHFRLKSLRRPQIILSNFHRFIVKHCSFNHKASYAFATEETGNLPSATKRSIATLFLKNGRKERRVRIV